MTPGRYVDRFSQDTGVVFTAEEEPHMTATVAPEVGAPLSKSVVNAELGTGAQSFKNGLDELLSKAKWAEAYTTEMLEAIGYTVEEANLLKSGLGEVAAVAAAVDATTFLKRFWGAA